MGAPEDEYEPEAAVFAGLLAQGDTITAEVVVRVWEQWFGPGSTFVHGAPHVALAKFADELNEAAVPPVTVGRV